MALPSTGRLSFSDIANEFSLQGELRFSDFFGLTDEVPVSGEIRISEFRGLSAAFKTSINTNKTNLDLRTFALAAGWDASLPVEITINSGVIISGNTQANSTAALTIDGAWPGGVTLINNGIIQGRGGDGGAGGDGQLDLNLDPPVENGFPGSAGGRALSVLVPVNIENNGSIRGGGGGGGGSGAYFSGGNFKDLFTISGSGGGGGQSSLVNSLGGAAGPRGGGNDDAVGNDGSPGTIANLGAGGDAVQANGDTSSAGGSGGSFGAAGQPGVSNISTTGGPGGAAGQAVSGNSNITWLNTGTRLGPIV
jgi:hypothetical protein